MTIEAITSAIMNYVTENQGINGTRVPKKQIRAEVHTLRGRLIREMVKSRLPVPADCYSLLKGIRLSEEPITLDCYDDMMESAIEARVAKIPKLITHPLTNKPLIRFSGNYNRSAPLRIIYGNQIFYFMEEEIHKDQPTLWVDSAQERVVLFDDTLETLQMECVVANPDSLIDYSFCDYGEESPYPADEEMIDHIIGKTQESYMRAFYRMQPVQRNGHRDTQGTENLPI